jgi:pilus assembly protein CpaB
VLTNTEELLTTDVVEWPQFSENSKEYVRPEQVAKVQGMKLLVPVQPNAPVRLSDLGPPGLAEIVDPNRRAYPIQVDNLSGIGNLITEGDSIDLLVTFPLEVLYVRPGFDESTESGELKLEEDTYLDNSTKTLLQDIKVIEILKQPPVEPTPGGAQPRNVPTAAPLPAGVQPTGTPAGPFMQTGVWVLILSVTDQQAEVIKYSLDKGGIMNLTLRRTGDRGIETTTGMTFDLIVRDYGVPLPRPLDLLRAQLRDTTITPTTQATPTVTPTATP